jgi:conjugal transfer pilus assembly protein TraE
MKASTYTKNFREALAATKIQKYANAALSGALLLMTILAFNQRERVVLVPPVVSEQLEIAMSSANADYHKAWALYVATFIGNINPGNSAFVADGLKLSFAPELYTEMRQRILEQSEELRVSGRSLRFFPDEVSYEKASTKTFVAGKQEIIYASGALKEQEVVYELQIKVRDGMPVVAQFDYYAGAPRTVAWLAKHSGAGKRD